jgi:hypothetical protein
VLVHLFDYIPESEVEVEKEMEEISNFHSILRQHTSELSTLGHDSLPISCIGIFSLNLIAHSLRFGEDHSTRLASGLKDDLVYLVYL